MIQRYIGTWEQQGILQGGGDLDTTTGSYCTYIFNSDFSYTAKGKDVNGKKINEDGTWKQILSTPCFVGKNGLCFDEEHKEGCGQTPMGVYRFNKAFGIARRSRLRHPLYPGHGRYLVVRRPGISL